MGLKWY